MIENMMMRQAGAAHIEIVDGSDIIMNNLIINDGDLRGILMGQVTDVVIQNSILTQLGQACIAILPSSGTTENVCIKGCFLEALRGVDCDAGTATLNMVVVEDCYILGRIELHGVVGAVIKNNFMLPGVIDGIDLTNSFNCEIRDNLIYGSNSDTTTCINITGNGGNHLLTGNILAVGLINVAEDATTGANSIFSNWAIQSPANEASNYVVMATTINKSIVDQSGTFPTPNPRKWHNISMTT